ncbi:MAG: DNA mismatch repair protein MutS, partial [bacterium]
GEFKTTELLLENISAEIERIEPKECLLPDNVPSSIKQIIIDKNIHITEYHATPDIDKAKNKLADYFKVKSVDSFGLESFPISILSSLGIMDYLALTQKTTLSHIRKIEPYKTGEFMLIDASTFRNLEILAPLWDGKTSLLSVLDQTETPMGGRLLKKWLREPLINIEPINKRLEAVEELFLSQMLRDEIVEILGRCYDIERLNGKVSSGSANAKDMIALKETLMMIPRLKGILKVAQAQLLKANKLPEMNEVVDLLERAINADPPVSLTDGGIIAKGYNSELDELRSLSTGIKDWIAKLEAEEKEKSGIKSLKVGYTRVFGYYIEITNSYLDKIPADYIRKQTLVNAERFITPELKEKEALILSADEKSKSLEYKLFSGIRDQVSVHSEDLGKIAAFLAQLDVMNAFSSVAVSNNYVRPEVSDDYDCNIIEGRHPVVEKNIGAFNYVPNDCIMNADKRFLLITGPNMAGKSTYLRQAALIQLMAQVGSFVPAKFAKLSLVDRIFSRIGARDDLASGQSTFMVEMTETANILNNATDKSLIILDEIGRGTSTFDGMSIAYAVAEYIHNKIGAKTLFATHYHELTQIAGQLSGIVNLNTAVKEEGDHVTFLHRIVDGSADRSYGIAVAKLAGLPDEVIDKAKEVYERLDRIEEGLSRDRERVDKRAKAKDIKDRDQTTLF